MPIRSTASRLTAILLLAGWMSCAQAIPIQWTLTDVLFSDGGVANGSFVYDADTDSYSAISVTTTDGSLVPVATFTSVTFGSASDAALVPGVAPDLTGQPTFQLVFQFPLTNSGGIVLLYDPFFPAVSSFDGACLNAGCTSVGYDRLVVDGGVIGAPAAVVPVPPALLLLGSALGLLGAARRAVDRRP